MLADEEKDWTPIINRWRSSPMFRQELDCDPEVAEEGLKMIRQHLAGAQLGGVQAQGELDLSTAEKRRKAIDAYIAEVWEKTGKEINREAIWRSLGYRDRKGFEWWQAMHRRSTKRFAEKMENLLTSKLHLKKVSRDT